MFQERQWSVGKIPPMAEMRQAEIGEPRRDRKLEEKPLGFILAAIESSRRNLSITSLEPVIQPGRPGQVRPWREESWTRESGSCAARS